MTVATVAVDFDGVIHSYERGWFDGSIYGDLVPGALDALVTLMDRYAVYVHTCRRPRQAARWIEEKSEGALRCVTGRREFWEERGVLLISNQKLPAVAYVDDRAIRFESWDQTLTALR